MNTRNDSQNIILFIQRATCADNLTINGNTTINNKQEMTEHSFTITNLPLLHPQGVLGCGDSRRARCFHHFVWGRLLWWHRMLLK